MQGVSNRNDQVKVEKIHDVLNQLTYL